MVDIPSNQTKTWETYKPAQLTGAVEYLNCISVRPSPPPSSVLDTILNYLMARFQP